MKLSEAINDADRLNRTGRHNLVWQVVDNLDEHATVMRATRNVHTRHRLGNVLQVYLMTKQLAWGDPMRALKQAIKEARREKPNGLTTDGALQGDKAPEEQPMKTAGEISPCTPASKGAR